MKGQHEALSVIMISGILIGVVGSVYFWGIPLIQKNKDIALLENSETFIKNLNEKIKYIANYGGRDQVKITLPGFMRFNADKSLEWVIQTGGTIYAKDSEIPMGKNDCTAPSGTWGIHGPEVMCLRSVGISENSYRTTFSLKYINLTSGAKTYLVNLTGDPSSGGLDHFLIITNKGTSTEGTLISTMVEISII